MNAPVKTPKTARAVGKKGAPTPIDGPDCADPGRSLIYRHVLSHFFDADAHPKIAMAPCRICGEVVPCVEIDRKTGRGTCTAQKAITAKRTVRLAPNEKPSHTARTEKGRNAFNEKDFVIVASAGASMITSHLPPTGPLPSRIDARRPADLSPFIVKRDLILDPPPVPYAVVIWAGRAASVPIVPTTFEDIVVINGGKNPVRIDRRRFAAALAAARLLGGIDGFENGIALQEAMAAGSVMMDATTGGKRKTIPVQDLLDKLASLRLNDLLATLAALPSRSDPETPFLRRILYEDAAARDGRTLPKEAEAD